MQGKDAPEQEAKLKCNVGIDVSKAWLDAHVLPAEASRRVANTAAGIRELKRWLRRFDPALIVVEATGKWHRPLQRSLFASGLPIAVVDPYRVRLFAKAQGILAKTDRLDARVLALFAALMAPPVRPPAPRALEQLAELVGARDSAVAEQTALKNQLAAATDSFLVRQLERRIAQIGQHIKALEQESLARIEADQALARRYAILTSIPGVGPVVAATLLTQLPELGACSAKQIGMLAGLAPIANDSGERQGAREIRGGRHTVRRVLYLAALTAARFGADLKGFYRRLVERGKTAKLATVAVARKLVVLANTLIAEDRTWQPYPPQHA
jgi:transposase